MKEDIKCYCGHTTYCDCSPLEQSKQKTPESIIQDIATHLSKTIIKNKLIIKKL